MNPPRLPFRFRPLAAVALVLSAAAGAAEPPLEEVVVFGRAEQLIGSAAAASEGTVGGADLAVRPLLRVAELLEAVPGMIAAQHSGSGKANQYFLRGFSLDHGTDFTTIVDGMPWNLRTHGHGQGYLDVNGLIPEVIERIEYRKGPYRADLGDFSLAGASFMSTIHRLDRPFLAVEAGEYGWGRVAAGGTTGLGNGELTVLGQWKTYDGPWQEPEKLKHGSMWSKYARATGWGDLAVSLWGYHARWHPTEQMPELSIGTPGCADVYCSLDPGAVGQTDRWILTSQLDTGSWVASGYVQYYDWRMISNPTYDFQIDQFDRRWTAGGRLDGQLFRRERIEVRAGAELRYDHIGRVGLDHTEEAARVENISDNRVREGSLGAWTEATYRPTDNLRLMAGLRADAYDFDVKARPGAGPTTVEGSEDDQQVSPKLAAAWKVSNNVELYANWGRGFHSNDARGVVNPDTPVPGLVRGTGYETGARFEVGTFNISATWWWLDVSSELIFVGDSNAVEPKDGARRRGYEVVAFWRPVPWLGLDAVYARSHARYKALQEDPDFDEEDPQLALLTGRHVEGAVEEAGEFGAAAVYGPWEASLRLRYLGPYPLVPSGTHRASSETTLNLRLAWTRGRTMLYGELLNALDRDGKDIRYYYETYVPGVTAPGEQIPTILSRVQEPRTFRAGVRINF